MLVYNTRLRKNKLIICNQVTRSLTHRRAIISTRMFSMVLFQVPTVSAKVVNQTRQTMIWSVELKWWHLPLLTRQLINILRVMKITWPWLTPSLSNRRLGGESKPLTWIGTRGCRGKRCSWWTSLAWGTPGAIISPRQASMRWISRKLHQMTFLYRW